MHELTLAQEVLSHVTLQSWIDQLASYIIFFALFGTWIQNLVPRERAAS